MIELTDIISQAATINTTVTLGIEQRVRSRLRVTLDDGREAGLFLPRGSVLRGGDLLTNNNSDVVQVIAADESVSTVQCNNPTQLAQAAYHLGNRHIPVQISADFLRYQHDHVLDDMLRQMGLTVTSEMAPFEPEAGAYQQASHSHQQPHSHSH